MASSLGLVADKQATPEPVVLGDPLTYTISFAYTGLVSATNVLVTDTLPAGTSYLTSGGGLTSTYDAGSHQLVWELGDVGPIATGQLRALVQPVDQALVGQAIENEAYLDFTSFANFSATVWVTSTVVTPQLSIYVDGNEPPDPLSLCEDDVVTLSAESNRAGPLTYAWNLGDGTVAGTAVLTHGWTYGDYTVWLTTTNAYGWVETDTLAVAVGHQPVAGFASNSPVRLGQNAVFTDMTTYDPAGWLWDFGDSVGTSTEPDPIYNYSNSGLYTVTLTVSNTCGADVYAAQFEVLASQFHYVYLPVIVVNHP
jgi:uncharacterized repeat protein (TIGR01451 family)